MHLSQTNNALFYFQAFLKKLPAAWLRLEFVIVCSHTKYRVIIYLTNAFPYEKKNCNFLGFIPPSDLDFLKKTSPNLVFPPQKVVSKQIDFFFRKKNTLHMDNDREALSKMAEQREEHKNF